MCNGEVAIWGSDGETRHLPTSRGDRFPLGELCRRKRMFVSARAVPIPNVTFAMLPGHILKETEG